MDKTTALNNLFVDWKQKYPSSKFAEDGIVKESLWNEAPVKILFILKETRDFSGNFRVEVYEKPWRILGYWAYGLINTKVDNLPPFANAKKADNWKEACRSVAILNLKKAPGGPNSDMKKIEENASKDKDLVVRELNIIKPEIVICCSVFNVIKRIFDFNFIEFPEQDERCYSYKDQIWIDYIHPSVRPLRHDMLYNTLLVHYQNALIIKRN